MVRHEKYLYYSNGYDDKMQLLSELIDKLNKALSTENASVDRIISRIDQTPNTRSKTKTKTALERNKYSKK